MARKLKVILRRSETKDYRNIASMIGSGDQVARGLSAARMVFCDAFAPAERMKALTYFKDGDLEGPPGADRRTIIEAAKSLHRLPAIVLRSKKLSLACVQILAGELRPAE